MSLLIFHNSYYKLFHIYEIFGNFHIRKRSHEIVGKITYNGNIQCSFKAGRGYYFITSKLIRIVAFYKHFKRNFIYF